MIKLLHAASSCYLGGARPVSIVHFVTNRCNARCAHCFMDFTAEDRSSDELTTDEIRTLTTRVGPSLINVNLTGGEPFLRPDLYEIAEAYFVNARVGSVFITTNGSLTERTRDFLERFKASGLRGKVILAVSIDDLEERHDENRGSQGLFSRAIATYRMARSFSHPRILANVAITVTDRNHERVAELYRAMTERYGVSSITATAMREEGVAPAIGGESRRMISDAYRNLVGLIRRDLVSGRMQGFTPSLLGSVLNAKNLVLYDLVQDARAGVGEPIPCPAGRIFAVISANGDVFPCEMLPGRRLGNLRESDLNFMEIWKAAEAEACRAFVRESRCACHYECALGVGVISSVRCLPDLLRHTAAEVVRGAKRAAAGR